MQKNTAKRFLCALLTFVMLLSMFSMVTVASADALDDELAGLTNYMIDGVVSDQWTLSGSNIQISNGSIIMHRRQGQTATTVDSYDLSGGFTFSGDLDFTGGGFRFSGDSYIYIGNMKIQFSSTTGSSPVTLSIYDKATGNLLGASYLPICDQMNAANALKKNYNFSVKNGLLTVKIDDTAIAFDTEDNMTVDVSSVDFSNSNIIIYLAWVGDPSPNYNHQTNIKLYSEFPYSTVADFESFLSGLTNKSDYADISKAQGLYDIVMANGSDDLKAEIEPYISYIEAARSLTWSEINVLTEENGTLLIDGAPYDGSAAATAGNKYTVTAVPNARYNFAAFVDESGNTLSTDASYTFTATSSTYIKATYIAKVYSNWSVTATEGGTVTLNGEAVNSSDEFEVGTSATIKAIANDGYCFLYWTDGKGEVVTTDAQLNITFDETVSYVANFSNNPDDILNYELSNIEDVLVDGFAEEDWTFANAYTPSDTNSKITNGQMALSSRGTTTAASTFTYDLSEGFNLSGNFNFSGWGHKMSDSYIKVGNLSIKFETSSGSGKPVYLQAINAATGSVIGTSEAIADTMYINGSSPLAKNYVVCVDREGRLTIKVDGVKLTWNTEAVSYVDVSAIDFSNSQVQLVQGWVSDAHWKINYQSDFLLTQTLPYSTVDEFQTYIDSIDTDDKAALAVAMHWVDVVEANASEELFSKFDTFNFYKAKYDVDSTVGGTVLNNGEAFVNDYRTTNRLAVGTVLNLTAQADAGYTFAYWADKAGNIKSTEKTLTVTLIEKGVFVTAVFVKDTADSSDTVNIYFKNRSGKIVSTVSVAKGSSVALPDLSTAASYGYTVNGWIVNGTVMASGSIVAEKDTIISADYSKGTALYFVSVNNAIDEINSSYNYNDRITVIFDESVLGNGEYFGGWANGLGTIVSYDKEYTFYVGADVTLNAVITTAAVDAVPTINVTDASAIADGAKASFLTERYVPEGFNFLEAGVIYTADDSYDSLTLDKVDGTSIRVREASSVAPCGQFRQTIGSGSGAALNISLAAYLIYSDAEGNIHTIYTNAYTVAINQ